MMRSARNVSRRWTSVTLPREMREIERLLDGGVAAADDEHVLALEEEAVAGGAGGDAEALEALLGGKAEPARLRAGRDDERIARSTCRRRRASAGTAAPEVGFDHRVGDHPRADMLACARICSISHGPWITSAKPG